MISQKEPTSFIKEKLHAVGDFYVRHRKLFAVVKLVLLVGVMVFAFSTRTPSGKVVHHGVSNIYAGGSGVCGNAICESTADICEVSSQDCTKISTGSCVSVLGCTVNTTDVYACAGTTFSCMGIPDKTTCAAAGCFRGSSCTNNDGKGKTTNETCSALNSQTTCGYGGGAAGDCSRAKTSSTQTCSGTITKPIIESDCTTLSGLIISFGLTVIRMPAYIENEASCPADCGAVCGNEIVEGVEKCDNGGSNSNTTPGACTTLCNGYVPAACSGTVVANSGACSTLALAKPSTDCGNYYYALGNQCTYNSKTFICEEGNACTISAAAVCGDSEVEGAETCDDGNTTDGDGCSSTCIYQAQTVSYTAGGTITVTYGSGVTYNGSKKWFVVPAGVTNIFTFTDSGVAIAYPGNDFVFFFDYTATGTVTNVSNSDTIEWNSDNDVFFMAYSGTNTYPLTGFTFTDNGVNMEAIWKDGSWSFSTITTSTCTGIAVADCAVYATKGWMLNGKVCTDYYSTSEEAQCVKAEGICATSTACTVPTETCGNSKVEGSETCDDGNTTDGDGCSSTCAYQEQNLSYIAGGSVTVTYGSGVTYNGSKKWFVVPAGVSVFTFTDSGVALGYGGSRIIFIISYTPTGSITNVSNSGTVAWSNSWSIFMMSYSGTVDYPLTGFTFTDGGVNNQAEYTGGKWSFSTVVGSAVCGDKKVEGSETCDDGNIKNNDGCSSTCVIETTYCGDNIISKGEVCDNGINNGKPGQCNSTCNGRATYNRSCGNGVCSTYCTIGTKITCNSLNDSESTKALCSTLGCFLQTTNNYTCNGAVSCEKITKATMYNDQYMVGKYCNLAGCSYDGKSGLCSTPAKAPNCSNLPAAEYCKMLSPMGCSLTTKTNSTSCVGDTSLRADKLDSNQCTTMNGTWAVEDEVSCPSDCKTTCTANLAASCYSLSVEECTDYYSDGKNCMVSKGACAAGLACNSCGNNVCDNKETYTTCPSDCEQANNWPVVSYTPKLPENGGLVSGPVVAKVNFGNGCTVLNNNASTSYTFNYNGYFIFKVSCPWLDGKILDVGAKVHRLQGSAKIMPNLNDISTTSGSNLYCENKDNAIGDVAANNTSMIEMTKKAIYQQSLTVSSSIIKNEFSDKVTISGNLSFANGSNTITKIELEKQLAGAATKAMITIPEGVTVKVGENGESDFEGVFLAPTLASDVVADKLSEQVKNITNSNVDLVVKFGDEENEKLTIVNSGDENEEFIISLQFAGYEEGTEVEIFSSQTGDVWTSYGFAKVDADGYVVFAVPHLTYYGLTTEGTTEEESTPTPTGTNGGGGGSVLVRDICPQTRDCSSSYYDRLCGPCPTTGDADVDTGKTITVTKSNEQLIAYQYAFIHGITTKPYAEARLEDGITRGEMAKMITNFAKEVLGKTPNIKKSCVFADNINGSKEDKSYIIQACQLGLMGLAADGVTVNKNFNPTSTLTRAEFGTVFSRLLYGNLYNTEAGSSVPYYANHLGALKRNGVMTKIDTPLSLELRGFVMIMMLRADLKDDGGLNLAPKAEDGTGIGEKITDFLENIF